jgi:type VI secretion system protein ImpK
MLMDRMYLACADAMSLGTQLATAQNLPSVDEVQSRIATLFETMGRKCREYGIPEEDGADARYAICAFMDEQILRSPWPGKTQWLARPLQLTYFNENTAGEGFFSRMEALERQPAKTHVLQIYYLALSLGFQGKYAVRGGEGLGALTDHVGAEVSRDLPPSEVLSPHGEPRDPTRFFVRRDAPIVALSVGFFGFALLVFLILKVILFASASDAASQMSKASPLAGSMPAAGVVKP